MFNELLENDVDKFQGSSFFPKNDIFSDFLTQNNEDIYLNNENFIRRTDVDSFDRFFDNLINNKDLHLNEENKKNNDLITTATKGNSVNSINMTTNIYNSNYFKEANSFPKENGITFCKKLKDSKYLQSSNKKFNSPNKPEKIFGKIEKNTKVKFFSMKEEEYNSLRTEKLKLNKLSAKKSRLKKKAYIQNLEKELMELKQKIRDSDYEKIISQNEVQYLNGLQENVINLKKIENDYNILSLTNNNSYISNININNNNNNNQQNIKILQENYKSIQNNFITKLIVMQINFLIPLDLKDFQNKYLKLNDFNEDDSLSIIENKLEHNIEMIKTIFSLDDYDNDNIVKNNKKNNCKYYKESKRNQKIKSIPLRLLLFYQKIKILVQNYIEILNK